MLIRNEKTSPHTDEQHDAKRGCSTLPRSSTPSQLTSSSGGGGGKKSSHKSGGGYSKYSPRFMRKAHHHSLSSEYDAFDGPKPLTAEEDAADNGGVFVEKVECRDDEFATVCNQLEQLNTTSAAPPPSANCDSTSSYQPSWTSDPCILDSIDDESDRLCTDENAPRRPVSQEILSTIGSSGSSTPPLPEIRIERSSFRRKARRSRRRSVDNDNASVASSACNDGVEEYMTRL